MTVNIEEGNLLHESVGLQRSPLRGRGTSDKWGFSDGQADGVPARETATQMLTPEGGGRHFLSAVLCKSVA